MKYQILSFFIIGCMLSCQQGQEQNMNEVLWYEYPAKLWNSQSLHLGNGYMGASFMGHPAQEVFVITEKTIWTGKPVHQDAALSGINESARASLPAIRSFIAQGKIQEADDMLQKRFLGKNDDHGSFATIGKLLMNFHNIDTSDVENYKRKLDLSQSLGSVAYRSKNVHHYREYFCSYPDRLMAFKVRADKKNAIGMRLGFVLAQDSFQTIASGNMLEVRAWINGNQRPFNIRLKVNQYGGEVMASGNQLHISHADSLEIFMTIATDYELKFPAYRNEVDPAQVTQTIIDSATQMGYDLLKRRHIADYRQLYTRVALSVKGNSQAEAMPTNIRWENYKKGESDAGLKVLAFNLGRYMIISSSRPGTLPANLQGVWNIFMNAPWAGNYQSNINIQQIYWSCGPTGLLECQFPYIEWIEDLVHAGRLVAERAYGTRGWVSHATGNIWGHAAPAGSLSWALYPVGSAWHCQHVWEQFAFSRDTAYLKQIAYPILREACIFYLSNLSEYEGHLILTPSVSAEHGAIRTSEGLLASSSSSGKDILYSMPGPSQDAQMIWDLFTNTMEASEILTEDKSFYTLLKSKRDSLYPLEIGKFGQLQEWAWDIDNPECRHRHISHLYAVCPGRQIDPLRDFELTLAAKKALDMRKEGRFLDADIASGGNWSIAHRMWCWVRLLEPERANRIFTRLLTEQGFENLLTFQHHEYHWEHPELHHQAGSDHTWYSHFQLDGSASVPGLMAEMLLQSHTGVIHLLPALPREFNSGKVSGLRARGNHTVDMEWKDGKLLKASIGGGKFASAPEFYLQGRKMTKEEVDKWVQWKPAM